MSRRAERSAAGMLVALGLALVGCRSNDRAHVDVEADAHPSEPAVKLAAADASSATNVVEASAPVTSKPAWADADDLGRTFFDATVRSARPIGHTSVVFKVELGNGTKAVFKPASRRGPTRYRGEIAAYRLARALGLVNVPPAYPASLARANLLGALGGEGSDGGALFQSEWLGSGPRTPGALIPWLDKLEFLPLEAEPLRSRSRGMLRADASIPDEPVHDADGRPTGLDARSLARQTSILLAFDYLTGNWDRWSGANVGLDRASGTLLFVDNDGAFFEVPPKDAAARNESLVFAVDRFSRSFVERLRTLEPEALARAIGDESTGRSLLPRKVLDDVGRRRTALLEAVDAKVAAHGDTATLAFP